jgi:hypothetical protein
MASTVNRNRVDLDGSHGTGEITLGGGKDYRVFFCSQQLSDYAKKLATITSPFIDVLRIGGPTCSATDGSLAAAFR